MFGHSYFGAPYFGGSYFGPESGGTAVIEDAALSASTSSGPVLSATIHTYPMSNTLIVGSTNEIIVKGLRRRNLDGTREYLNDADVELTAVLDANGDPVPGTQNIAMPYISGIGRSIVYGSAIPHTVPFVPDATYTKCFTSIDTDGNVLVIYEEVIAQRKTG